MAYTPHDNVKAQKLSLAAVKLLERQVKVPNLFTKKGVDEFKGAEDDTLNMTVPGVLPFREYAWRNDRSQPLQLDTYSERKISVSFGGNVYSAVELTDEQKEFDLDGWSKLLAAQTRAVGRGLEHRAVSTLEGTPWEVVVDAGDGDGAAVSRALVEARRVMNRFNVPLEQRYLLVGSDFDAALQNASLFNVASNVGDGPANSALRDAVIGRWKEFTIIGSNEIAPDAAYAFNPGAFVFLNAAPAVPRSVPVGATSSYNGIAVRWMQDYDSMYLRDRSIVNTYAGFDRVVDPIRGIGEDGNEVVSEAEYFVRGVKLGLGATTKYPAADSELATLTGVTAPAAGGGDDGI